MKKFSRKQVGMIIEISLMLVILVGTIALFAPKIYKVITGDDRENNYWPADKPDRLRENDGFNSYPLGD